MWENCSAKLMPLASCSRVNDLVWLPQVTSALGASRLVTLSISRLRFWLNGT